MELKSEHIKIIQQLLNIKTNSNLIVDGRLGNKTKTALNSVGELNQSWNLKRKLLALIQNYCNEIGIDAGKVDGYWGPQTAYAFDTLKYFLETGNMPPLWRDENPLDVNPNNWPKMDEDKLIEFYGNIGENQKRIQLPYPHRLSWDKRKVINSFLCHEKVHDSLYRVLSKVLEYYGIDKIKELKLDLWGGCLNIRQMRGGSKYSMHSWGIAIDYNPDENQLRWGRDKAVFAKPEYDMWWKFWEEEGWSSLGRTKNYDWMHVQAAKI